MCFHGIVRLIFRLAPCPSSDVDYRQESADIRHDDSSFPWNHKPSSTARETRKIRRPRCFQGRQGSIAHERSDRNRFRRVPSFISMVAPFAKRKLTASFREKIHSATDKLARPDTRYNSKQKAIILRKQADRVISSTGDLVDLFPRGNLLENSISLFRYCLFTWKLIIQSGKIV